MIKRWMSKIGVWGWISIAVGGFLLALMLSAVGAMYWHTSRVDAMFASIREAGEPVTFAELAELLPLIPPDRNATQHWLDGFAAHGPTDQRRFAKLPFLGDDQPDDPPPPGSAWAELPLAETYLSEQAVALKAFHQAASLGGAARLAPRLDPNVYPLQALRHTNRLLLLESLVAAHAGNSDECFAALQAALTVGAASANEPFMIRQLIRYACNHAAIAETLRLLPRVAFSDEQLERLQAHVRALEDQPANRLGLLGERVHGIAMLQDPASWGPGVAGGPGAIGTAIMGRFAMPHYLTMMDDAVAAAELPWPDALAQAEVIDSSASEIPPLGSLAKLIAPSIRAYLVAGARSAVMARLGDIALAAQRYRLANGRLPETLGDLVPAFLPAIPLDPFTGEPLHYRPSDDGFVVYSVGEDSKDDGGPLEEFCPREPDLGYRIRYPQDAADAGTE